MSLRELSDHDSKNGDQLSLRVAIFSNYRAVVPHFETELDIAQQHLDRGDSVTFFQCQGALANCEFNVERDEATCQNCRGRREMGVELLSAPVLQIDFLDEPPPADLKTSFESVGELVDYQIDGFDIGYAALSSLVSFCRDPDPNLEKHSANLKRFLISAWQTYQQTIRFLSEHQFDRVYLYNGRFAGMRSTLRACQKLGVDCFLHERGCDGGHFELLKNHLPHDLVKIEEAIVGGWERAKEDPRRDEIARSWFQDRFGRVEKVWHSFTKNQQRNRLPESWNSSEKNVSIFSSSDDEFVAIGDAWKNEMYPNQVEAIERIVVDMLNAAPDTMIYLRMHPNLSGLDNERCRRMKALDFPNLTVIEPEDEIDTYRLITDSDTVVSFGSSVGAEAVYWGTPSVLLGPCFYQNLGGLYRSRSHAETIELLCRDLQPQEADGILKYGFWFQTRGFPHKYFSSTALFEGTFKGETIYARPPGKPKGLKRLASKFGQLFSKM